MEKEIENLLAQLQQDKSLKVWSLIITFFGDVVLARGGNVSAKTVQQLLGAMGVGAGAVRTALSRLATDSWIERQKVGRESYYELASKGCELSHRAAARIYAPVLNGKDVSEPGQWRIAIARPGSAFSELPDDVSPGAVLQVAANCRLYFTAEDSDADFDDSLVVSGDLQQAPSWVTENLIPESVRSGYQTIVSQFSTISKVDLLSPLNCLVLRCLLVHEWRRLLLRMPVVPLQLQSPMWPEHDCRRFVAELYQQLVVKSELWVDQHATCINGSLPEPADAIENRFTKNFQTL